jgi:hypothetical protein
MIKPPIYLVSYYSDTDYGITSMVAYASTIKKAMRLFKQQVNETLSTEVKDTVTKRWTDRDMKIPKKTTEYEVDQSRTVTL